MTVIDAGDRFTQPRIPVFTPFFNKAIDEVHTLRTDFNIDSFISTVREMRMLQLNFSHRCQLGTGTSVEDLAKLAQMKRDVEKSVDTMLGIPDSTQPTTPGAA